MRTLITLLLSAVALSLSAKELGLVWDPSPDASVTNYVLYGTAGAIDTNNLDACELQAPVGVTTNATVELPANETWQFVVTAQGAGLESEPSNVYEARWPLPPGNLRPK